MILPGTQLISYFWIRPLTSASLFLVFRDSHKAMERPHKKTNDAASQAVSGCIRGAGTVLTDVIPRRLSALPAWHQ